MKRHFLLMFILAGTTCSRVFAQQVAINEDGSLPNPNAILDIKSFNKGVLLPRTSTATRLLIPNTKGLIVYDTTTQSFWYNTGSVWQNLAGVPSSGTSWLVNGNSATTDANFIGTTDSISFRLRVNNQPSGFMSPQIQGSTTWGYKSHGLNDPAGTYENTAIGSRTMYKNTGSFNTAVGSLALHNNAGGYSNVAMGYATMIKNTSGSNNAAVGSSALSDNTTGNENTAMGFYALLHTKTRTGNSALGYNSGPINDYANTVSLGSWATPNWSNKVRIGSASIMEIEGQVPYTTPSDGRFKYSVQEDVKGLDFILKLRPVTYNFDALKFDEQLHSGVDFRPNQDMLAAYEESKAVRRSGFIAQEVEKAADGAGYNFSGLLRPRSEKDYYSISYESFVPALVKAVQELNKKVEELMDKNAELRYEIKVLTQNLK